ncbi:hypothetical protein ACIP5Y_07075 [Nocardia sp. NPDC088792]|uniref:hypothetical protein n=1 Tax=Nocardia sp. NPDC088792 TaxID=3364332 RepID=UPI0038289075
MDANFDYKTFLSAVNAEFESDDFPADWFVTLESDGNGIGAKRRWLTGGFITHIMTTPTDYPIWTWTVYQLGIPLITRRSTAGAAGAARQADFKALQRGAR